MKVIIHERKNKPDEDELSDLLKANVMVCDKDISAVELLKREGYSDPDVYVVGHSSNGNIKWAQNDVEWIKNNRPDLTVIAWQEEDYRSMFKEADEFVPYNNGNTTELIETIIKYVK